MKLHTDTFLSAKFDNDMRTFFVANPDQKFLLIQNLLLSIHSYSSPHFIWTNSWLDWRILFVKLHTETFISANFDNDMSTFFVDNHDQTIFLFQNLPVCIHSYASAHFIWTSSWLDWKTVFVKLHRDTFWAQNLTTTWVHFLVDKPNQKILLFQNLQGCIHSYSSPHSLWTSLWL